MPNQEEVPTEPAMGAITDRQFLRRSGPAHRERAAATTNAETPA